ncbi:hypothetical protein [Thermus aquaticus]|jgi:hypothetical protein|uniref:Uncharacterized protein n=1 Tax=Thermus aquaticus (strain ATCC BAA-2747 / Y51MC23) TaxID=498848 RepID=A0ABM5VMX9_THEA5|nr:hypothetical protein [Thermus aquaticus]ALJ91444.1 hypothetical protein TO73_1605 [Thermus aquaticus Y51MC23]
MQVLVLGVNAYTRKDGTRSARVVVASTPSSSNFRGLNATEIEALPEIADAMTAFPAIYALDVEMRVASGFGGNRNQVAPVITSARLVAPVGPLKGEGVKS